MLAVQSESHNTPNFEEVCYFCASKFTPDTFIFVVRDGGKRVGYACPECGKMSPEERAEQARNVALDIRDQAKKQVAHLIQRAEEFERRAAASK